MSAKPIPAKDVAASIMKIMDKVASEYPEEEREELMAPAALRKIDTSGVLFFLGILLFPDKLLRV
jgi:hypothetical protein